MMTKSKVLLASTSLVLAAGLIGAKILIAPSVSEAAIKTGIDPEQIMLAAPKGLPSFDDSYQRHMGVLDTLKTP